MTGQTLILIPAYLEEKRIGAVVKEALHYGKVLVVDDGSTDCTAQEAEASGAEVIRQEINRGKGAAIKTGFNRFLEGDCQGIVLMDGDGQHDPREIALFTSAASDPSVMMVVGNRMGKAQNMPIVRKATNWLMSKILSFFVGVDVPDTQCGFRWIRRALVEKIKLRSDRFDVESDLLIEAGRVTKNIVSVPVSTIYRDEKSKIKPVRDTLRFFRLMFRALRRGRPKGD